MTFSVHMYKKSWETGE